MNVTAASMLLALGFLAAHAYAGDPLLENGAGDAKADVPPASYTSPFAAYRGFREQPVRNWQQSNDVVFRLGGWKAFAGGNTPNIDEPPEGSTQRAPESQSRDAKAHDGHGDAK